MFSLSELGIFSVCRKIILSKGKLVLMFHGVASKKSSKVPKNLQPHIDIAEFESIVKWIKSRFKFIKPADLFDSNSSGMLLTFDDGFDNNFKNVLPILNKYEIPALFFITTQHISNPNKWLHFIEEKIESNTFKKSSIPKVLRSDFFNGISEENLFKMSKNKLVTIGSHTITHPLLSQCSKSEIKKEIFESKEYLEMLIGKSVDYFAYPSGDYNEEVINQVIACGYRAGFGIDTIKNFGFPSHEIPRVGIYSNNISYLSAKLSGLYQRPINKII